MGIAYNVIAAFDRDCENSLMWKRRKNPYIDLYNLVGGKIEPGDEREDSEQQTNAHAACILKDAGSVGV